MKKCAILTSFDPYSYKGGIEAYTHQVVQLLQSHGIMVDIYHTGSELCLRTARSTPRSFHSQFLNDLYPVGRSFYQVDHQYDFVIAHAFFGFGYCPPRIPAFNIFHSTHVQYAEENRLLFSPEWYHEVKHLFGFGAEWLSTVGRKVITVSDAVAQEVAEHYGVTAGSTVLTGVDRTTFFPRRNREELRKKFAVDSEVFVGIFLARWGCDKGIDVLESVVVSAPEVHWLFVLGTGAPCPLKGRANVTVVENVSHEEVAELLSLGDFLFHPSRYEGFGLAVIEAMACGLPVVTAPVGVARTVCTEDPFLTLLLPEYRNGKEAVIAATVEKIARLRRDKELRRILGEAGESIVEKRFDRHRWERDFLAAVSLDTEDVPACELLDHQEGKDRL
jgi:glycosyltransferase involved in cell wall biosynthesis